MPIQISLKAARVNAGLTLVDAAKTVITIKHGEVIKRRIK